MVCFLLILNSYFFYKVIKIYYKCFKDIFWVIKKLLYFKKVLVNENSLDNRLFLRIGLR